MKEYHTFTSITQDIYYFIVGTSASTPMVLIHGYGASGNIWQRTLPYLARDHQVLVVDLPGYGRSKLTSEWRLREMGPQLAEWLQQMRLPPVTVVGHSMGGAIAAHLASSAPDLVERLVLINAAGLPLQTDLPMLALRAIRSFLQLGSNGGYPITLLRDSLSLRLDVLWQTALEMKRSDFRAEFAALALPTLIIWGEHDPLLPISLGRILSATMPQATFVTLPCGHRPMLALPGELSRLILQFLC